MVSLRNVFSDGFERFLDLLKPGIVISKIEGS